MFIIVSALVMVSAMSTFQTVPGMKFATDLLDAAAAERIPGGMNILGAKSDDDADSVLSDSPCIPDMSSYTASNTHSLQRGSFDCVIPSPTPTEAPSPSPFVEVISPEGSSFSEPVIQ